MYQFFRFVVQVKIRQIVYIIAQNIVRYAQALNADATIYWGTLDQNLANMERKAILVSDLKMLKSQIEIIDRLLV